MSKDIDIRFVKVNSNCKMAFLTDINYSEDIPLGSGLLEASAKLHSAFKMRLQEPANLYRYGTTRFGNKLNILIKKLKANLR